MGNCNYNIHILTNCTVGYWKCKNHNLANQVIVTAKI
jgi:hypothetical protein